VLVEAVRVLGLGLIGVLGLIGFVVGWFVGAVLGGNYATDFHLAGVRGYEATGAVGAILGAICGVVLGWWMGWRWKTTQ
jgi:hypothetical protein